MIFDSLRNAGLYSNLGPEFKLAFDWLASPEAAGKPFGRYELDGDKVVAIPQGYDTHPFQSGKFEVHSRYADIQYIAGGSERIAVADPETLDIVVPFDAAKDIAFYRGPEDAVSVRLRAGDFMVIFPHEAHQPCMNPAEVPVAVHKIVVKVRV